MKFADIVQDTPRMVVVFERDDEGNERFRWGMVGSIPILTLIGYTARVQAELWFPPHRDHCCDERALVIAWDAVTRRFYWWVNPGIPVDSLVGMLDAVKLQLHSGMAQKQQEAQPKILLPNGQPMPRTMT